MSHKRTKSPSHSCPRLCAFLLCFMAAVVMAAAPIRAAALPRQGRQVCHVKMSAAVARKVAIIQERYRAATDKTLDITSGTRSARCQALAMLGKLRAGSNLSEYIDQTSAREVLEAYRLLTAASGRSDEEIVTALGAVIQAQIDRGVFLSKHLRAGAVDVRSRGMTARQRAAFRAASAGIASVVLLESRPPHWHLQFDP